MTATWLKLTATRLANRLSAQISCNLTIVLIWNLVVGYPETVLKLIQISEPESQQIIHICYIRIKPQPDSIKVIQLTTYVLVVLFVLTERSS